MQADRGFLQGLKGYQDRVQLSDEVAEEVMREAARTKLERCLTTAVEAVKKRTRVRDFSPAIQVHMHALDFTSAGILHLPVWRFSETPYHYLHLLLLGQLFVNDQLFVNNQDLLLHPPDIHTAQHSLLAKSLESV